MTRPPPLQLLGDNMFPDRGFCSQGCIIGVAVLNALRFMLSAANAFQDVQVDKSRNAPNLAITSTALTLLYTAACAIDIFGVVSASMQRLTLIRIYAHLTFLSAFLVTVAGLVGTATYFVFADDVIDECVSLAMDGVVGTKSTFGGDPWPKTTGLSMDDAQTQCLFAWSSESSSQVSSIFIFYLFPSTLYCLLAYTYYRQVTDPRHPANLRTHGSRGRGSSVRMDLFPNAHYNQLHNTSGSLAYSDAHRDSPPRSKRRSPEKQPPGTYRAPVLQMAESSSLDTLTPGPPSFGVAHSAYPHYNGYSPGPDDDKVI